MALWLLEAAPGLRRPGCGSPGRRRPGCTAYACLPAQPQPPESWLWGIPFQLPGLRQPRCHAHGVDGDPLLAVAREGASGQPLKGSSLSILRLGIVRLAAFGQAVGLEAAIASTCQARNQGLLLGGEEGDLVRRMHPWGQLRLSFAWGGLSPPCQACHSPSIWCICPSQPHPYPTHAHCPLPPFDHQGTSRPADPGGWGREAGPWLHGPAP